MPSVAALAARLLAANPQWSTAELKAAIVDLAQPVGPEVRHGWIAAPGLL